MRGDRETKCNAPVPGGCNRDPFVRGLCRAHYQRRLRGLKINTPIRRSIKEVRQGMVPITIPVPRPMKDGLTKYARERGIPFYEAMQEAIASFLPLNKRVDKKKKRG